MSERYAAFGTIFGIGNSDDPSTASFTDVAGVRNIQGPGFTLDVEDATAHDSADAWEEVVATIKRSGTITLDLAWDPDEATHESISGGVLYELTQRRRRAYQIEWPDSTPTVWKFRAFCTGFTPAAPHEGLLTSQVTYKLTGAPTLG
jgi:hypothetical protein